MASRGKVYKEGDLLKRQRGLTQKTLKNMKFQQRYCHLTGTALEYSNKKTTKMKGKFEIDKILIVESVPQETFGKEHCFQVGDDGEVMYFVARTRAEKNDWIQAFRKAASEHGNDMLPRYHTGAYGMVHNDRWSCCGSRFRIESGCSEVKTRPRIERTQSLPYKHLGGSLSSLRHTQSITNDKPRHDTWLQSQFQRHSFPAGFSENALLGEKEEESDDDELARSTVSDSGKGSSIAPSAVSSRRSSRNIAKSPSMDSILKYRTITESPSMDSMLKYQNIAVSPTDSMGRRSSDLAISDQGGLRKVKKQATSNSKTPPFLRPLVQRRHEAKHPKGENLLTEGEIEDEDPLHSPLHGAFINENYQGFKRILEEGVAEPNELLHLASERGCTDFVRLLIEHKANVNQRDTSGNLPLSVACRNGHLDVVELLLERQALIDEDGAEDRTPLHEAAHAGHQDVVELLIRKGANGSLRDSSNATPYDLAYTKGHKKVMEVIKQSLHESVRPYTFLHSSTPHSSEVTTLAFRGLTEVLVSGSKDCHAYVWDAMELSSEEDLEVSNTVLSVDIWRHYLVMGSTNIQLIDMDNMDQRKTLTGDIQHDENPPLHLVAFDPQGYLATASVESNTVKLWPPPSSDWMTAELSDTTVTVGTEPGCICSLMMSPSRSHRWMAVGIQPGEQFAPTGNKFVHLFNLKTDSEQYFIDTGHGGLDSCVNTAFSPDGQRLAVGCGTKICIYETESGNSAWEFNTTDDIPLSSLSYSPSGVHISAGLTTGEVQVFGVGSGIHVFTLDPPDNPSPASTMTYSKNGTLLAVGHQDGTLQLWEAYTSYIAIESDVPYSTGSSVSAQEPCTTKPPLLAEVIDSDPAKRPSAEEVHEGEHLRETIARSENATIPKFLVHSPPDTATTKTLPDGSVPKALEVALSISRDDSGVAMDSHTLTKSPYPGLHFLQGSPWQESITSGGRIIPWDEIGIQFDIPAGAVPERRVLHLTVWPCLNGRYVLPDGYNLASPAFMISPEFDFRREVKMSIVHFLDLQSRDECERMVFLSARSTPRYKDGKPEYHFKVFKKGVFQIGQSSGSISLDHFCVLAIGRKRKRDEGPAENVLYSIQLYQSPDQALFSMTILHPLYDKSLKVMLREQFPEVNPLSSLVKAPVNFSHDEVSLDIPTTSMSGWMVAPRTTPCQISKDEVDLPLHLPNYAPSEVPAIYPPRLLLTLVHPQDPPHRQTRICELPVHGLTKQFSFHICLRSIALANGAEGQKYHKQKHQPSNSDAVPHCLFSVSPTTASEPRTERDYVEIEDKRPLLLSLLKFPGQSGPINIPAQIGTNSDFGIFLLNDDTGAIVDDIERKHRGNSYEINKAILSKWLQGHGREPFTWRTLIDVLQDAKLVVLAKDIRTNLSKITKYGDIYRHETSV